MIIDTPAYISSNYNSNHTMLRLTNVVKSVSMAKVVVFDLINIFEFEILPYVNHNIIIDGSAELLPINIVELCNEFKEVSNIKIYTNGLNEYHKYPNFENLIKSGLEVINQPFFLKYMDYYTPVRISNIELKKKALLFIGKPKPERISLLGMLSYHGLIDDIYISYFGDNPHHSFYSEKESDYYKSHYSDNQKSKVRIGMNMISTPMILDTPVFDYNTSHSRKYSRDYYDAVEFVIVCESDIRNQFITEKLAKCIQLNKPFILLGKAGLLQYVKDQSLIHLNKDISHLTNWCDTIYDQIENYEERIECIVEIIRQNL